MDEEGWCICRSNILCSHHERCGSCGWNPRVEAKRKAKLRSKIVEAKRTEKKEEEEK